MLGLLMKREYVIKYIIMGLFDVEASAFLDATASCRLPPSGIPGIHFC
jgi:hypothetical protein